MRLMRSLISQGQILPSNKSQGSCAPRKSSTKKWYCIWPDVTLTSKIMNVIGSMTKHDVIKKRKGDWCLAQHTQYRDGFRRNEHFFPFCFAKFNQKHEREYITRNNWWQSQVKINFMWRTCNNLFLRRISARQWLLTLLQCFLLL